ncbi:hypothetical protein J3F83DRAFT_77788 [Trichoderma novae-zelandiae]
MNEKNRGWGKRPRCGKESERSDGKARWRGEGAHLPSREKVLRRRVSVQQRPEKRRGRRTAKNKTWKTWAPSSGNGGVFSFPGWRRDSDWGSAQRASQRAQCVGRIGMDGRGGGRCNVLKTWRYRMRGEQRRGLGLRVGLRLRRRCRFADWMGWRCRLNRLQVPEQQQQQQQQQQQRSEEDHRARDGRIQIEGAGGPGPL